MKVIFVFKAVKFFYKSTCNKSGFAVYYIPKIFNVF